jgi:hypothetical protein
LEGPVGTGLNAARKEGKVVVFGPAGELIRNSLVEAFKKAIPASFSNTWADDLQSKRRD